jgi:hypothetical protein
MSLKIISLPISNSNGYYLFERFSGLLLSKPRKSTLQNTRDSTKLNSFLGLNNQPYKLSSFSSESVSFNKGGFLVRFYAILLTKIIKFNFFLGRVFAKLGYRYFSDSKEAVAFFRKHICPSQQNDLCLARTLFAAATSKKFKENGVIFIGVFLPSKSMHAWIIENGAHTDLLDGIWINYQPVAAIYYEKKTR